MVNYTSRLVLFIGFALTARLLCVSPASLGAQTVSGTILGLVHDQQGGAIGKAEVSARSIDTGALRTATSEDNGAYRIASIPAGAYEISVTAPGFKTEVRRGIEVTVGGDVSANFSLTVGAVTERVEVSAEAVQVDTSTSAMGGFVNSTTMRELPLNGRDWLQLALLQPGAIQNAGSVQDDSSRVQRGNGLQISISGGRMTDNVFRVDGLVVNDYANSGPGSNLRVNLGVDAVREFSVLTNNYTAEYGRGSSGVINAIYKSGANDFHGSTYYFHRNSALDARNFFDQKNVPPFRRHQYGGALGGRIIRDKTFFFTNYETLTELRSLSASTDTLTANAKNGILCANAACTSTTVVPVDPRIRPYLSLYPNPNGPITGDVGKFLAPAPRVGDEKFVILKMDHYFSPNTTLSGSYMFDNTSVVSPDGYILKDRSAPSRKQNGIITLQHVFTPTLINNARAGITRTFAAQDIDGNPRSPLLTDLSLGFVPGRTMGTLSVSGLVGGFGGIGASSGFSFGYTAPQFYDDLTWNNGRHNVRMGFAFERILDNRNSSSDPNGSFSFTSIANMLRVMPQQFRADFPGTDAIRGSRMSIIAGYIQDDFRILPNLTLNLGLRYEVGTVLKEVNGKVTNLRGITDRNPVIGDPWYKNPTLKNFAPRIGFAWDPFKDGKTALRGGVGMFDIIPMPYLFLFVAPRGAPFFMQGLTSAPTLTSAHFPNSALSLLTPNSVQATHVEFNPSRPYKIQWNMNIQRQLNQTTALTLGYVGAVGVHLAVSIYDTNQVALDRVRVVNDHLTFPIPPAGTGIQYQNPNWGQIRAVDWNGHSTYHSLQTNLVQRPARGLMYQIAYTYSKSLDNGTTPTAANESFNSLGQPYAFCTRCNRGPSDFDLTHNFVTNFLYDIPVPSAVKSHGFSNTVLGGWQLGGIYTRQSGGFLNPKLSSDRAFTGDRTATGGVGGQRSDWLAKNPGCANPTTGNIDAYIKTECFAFPEPGVLGNLGRNRFRMPTFRSLDFSVYKNQNLLGEKLKAQFRLEMFNVLNHTNLAGKTFALYTGTGVLNPTAGTPQAPTVGTSRQIQLGLRLLF